MANAKTGSHTQLATFPSIIQLFHIYFKKYDATPDLIYLAGTPKDRTPLQGWVSIFHTQLYNGIHDDSSLQQTRYSNDNIHHE